MYVGRILPERHHPLQQGRCSLRLGRRRGRVASEAWLAIAWVLPGPVLPAVGGHSLGLGDDWASREPVRATKLDSASLLYWALCEVQPPASCTFPLLNECLVRLFDAQGLLPRELHNTQCSRPVRCDLPPRATVS
eukprot:scaffold196_cov371-Prasinococcus_capsulatus_cf.AAC.20